MEEGIEQETGWKIFAKYFVHGIAFSLLFLLLGIAWIFILVILVRLGFIIGLIIGFGLLFLIVGFLNSIITVYLWFDVKMSFLDLFFHGLALFVILLIVNGISVTLPSLVFPGIATSAVTFIIASFLDGFAAKEVAGRWRQEHKKSVPKAKSKFYPTIICPSCGKKISEEYHQCPWCGTELQEKTYLTKFCPSCNRKITDEYYQCPWCGERLK